MPWQNGTGPTGEGRPGRGLGRCGKAKQGKESDTGQHPGKTQDNDTPTGRGAGNGGGRGQGGKKRRGRM